MFYMKTTDKGEDIIALGLYLYFNGNIYHLTMLDYLGLTVSDVLGIRSWAANGGYKQHIATDDLLNASVAIKQLHLINCFSLNILIKDPDPVIASEARWRIGALLPRVA